MNKALAVAQTKMTLASLKPPVGTRIQLECPGISGRLSSKLLGFQEGGSLMVACPQHAGKSVSLADGTQITVRLINGTSICGFSVKLLCSYEAPFAHWHLEYPEDVTHRRIRQQTRVPVNLIVSVDEFEEGTLDGSSQWPRNLLCNNISLTGASLLSKQPLGKVGDRLYLTLRVTVAAQDQVVLVPAVIRNLPAGGEGKDFQYGIEFFDLGEDARLVLAGFVYQQCLLETGYRDYLAEVGH